MSPMEPELPRRSPLSALRWTVVLSIALATADNFADPDLWIHMLTGQTILRTGHIPRFDTYSYSAAGMPWHNHEWLSQLAMAFCYAHLGVFGLKLSESAVRERRDRRVGDRNFRHRRGGTRATAHADSQRRRDLDPDAISAAALHLHDDESW